MFAIKDRGSTVGREVLGGATTFMAMSYIIFVQVAVLGSIPGMDPGGVMMATCLSAALSSVLMGLWANYPVALAPGMGENFFFVGMAATLAAWGLGAGWQMALALTLVPGVIILLLTATGFRSYVLDMIPNALKSGIAAGIGLFIAVIGFNEANLVVPGGALVRFPGFAGNFPAWLTMIVLAITVALMAFRVRGAILLGILAGACLAVAMGKIQWCGWPVGWPGGLEKTAGGFAPGFVGVWKALTGTHAVEILTFTFILLFMDLFDSVGTLVGVAQRAGLMVNGKLPKASQALAADAVGTVAGAALGVSTVTSYIESVTGVAAGARTGLAAIVAGVLLALATFFGPLVKMIGGGIEVAEGVFKQPLIAPAMIIVGAMMLRVIRDIDWEDVTEYLPAFLTVVTMPLAYSISTGIAIGFVSYAFGKLVSGRVKECPLAVYLFAVLFVVQYVWIMPKG
jgi:AGZA family xanthine/uracil permease-like MFS transporter